MFEEAAGGVVVALGLRGLRADGLPAGLVLQFFAAFEEGFEAFGEVLVGPLRQCGVIDGGVGRAAARRADGRAGGGALSCGQRGAVGVDRVARWCRRALRRGGFFGCAGGQCGGRQQDAEA